MKFHRHLLKTCILSKTMVVYLLVQTGLSVFALKMVTPTSSASDPHTIWTQVYTAMANDIQFLFLYIPLFLMLTLKAFTMYYNTSIIIKYPSIKLWWQKCLRITGIFSLMFTVIIHLSLVLVLSIHGSFFSVFNEGYIGFFLLSIFFQFSGFVIIGQACMITALLSQQLYWGIIFPLGLLLLIKSVKYVLKGSWATFEEYMSSMYKFENAALHTHYSDIIIVLGFSLFFYLCYLGALLLLKEKDFIWR